MKNVKATEKATKKVAKATLAAPVVTGPTQPSFEEAVKAAQIQVVATPAYKQPNVADINTGDESSDGYFSESFPKEKKEQILKSLGHEITENETMPEAINIYNHFRQFFPKREGHDFKLYVNPFEPKVGGMPLTVVVPIHLSTLQADELELYGCHRVSTIVPSLVIQQVGETLAAKYKQIIGNLKKYVV